MAEKKVSKLVGPAEKADKYKVIGIEEERRLPAPDIEHFVRRKGMSGRVYPYKLANAPFNRVVESSNGTPTINRDLMIGLGMALGDLQQTEKEYQLRGIPFDRVEHAKELKLDCLHPIPTGSPVEAGAKAYKQIEDRWPVLKQWPPKNLHRPGRPLDKIREVKRMFLAQAIREGKDPVEWFSKNGIKTPVGWRNRGLRCPEDYVQAFKDPRWRLRIQKELSSLRASLR